MSGVPSENTRRHRDDRQGFSTLACCQARTTPATVLRSARPIAAVAEQLGRHRQLLGLGGAAQEGEIRLDAELGIGEGRPGCVHAKIPCMNQRGGAAAAP